MTEKVKKVIFSIPENDKAKFKVQLHYDSLSQRQFLEGIIEAYTENDPHFMNFIATLKEKLHVQSKPQLAKAQRNKKDAKETKDKFALGDDEVENIFDILEQEYPDL
jgi:adenine C2-methylase RlmN of 23S rRNA A2503 and tRNA A37